MRSDDPKWFGVVELWACRALAVAIGVGLAAFAIGIGGMMVVLLVKEIAR